MSARKGFFAAALAAAFLCRPAFAATPSTVFEIRDGRSRAYCGLVGATYVPVVKVSGKYRTASSEASAAKKKAQRSIGRTRDLLRKREKTLRALITRTATACKAGPSTTPGAGPAPAPTATPGSSPAPTPTPVSLPGCFAPGNNTRPGCFGIPSGLTGNIDRGQTAFRNQCTGCHTSRPARTYTQLQSSFDRIPQMQPFRPGAQDLADITAYLNRFNF